MLVPDDFFSVVAISPAPIFGPSKREGGCGADATPPSLGTTASAGPLNRVDDNENDNDNDALVPSKKKTLPRESVRGRTPLAAPTPAGGSPLPSPSPRKDNAAAASAMAMGMARRWSPSAATAVEANASKSTQVADLTLEIEILIEL